MKRDAGVPLWLLHADLCAITPVGSFLLRLAAISLRQLAENLLQALVVEPTRLGDQVPLGGLHQAGLDAGALRQAARQTDLCRGQPLLSGRPEELSAAFLV